MATESILDSVKENLTIDPEYKAFDQQLITFINMAFATLNQLGVGPDEGFIIEDEVAKWIDFTGSDPRFASVKTYVTLKTRILFDPPATGYLVTAFEKQINELEWRLNVLSEEVRRGTTSSAPAP